MQRRINVIGDSHCLFFAGTGSVERKPFLKDINIPFTNPSSFAIYHVGPALAYNLHKKDATVKANEKIHYLIDSKFIRPNDIIVFCFGEIDCRYHLPKRVSSERSIHDVVQECIEKYMLFIKSISNNMCIIYGPIATAKDVMPMNREFPRFGTEKLRNQITAEFNRQLESYAKDKLKFFSIFKYMIDENYQTNPLYISSDCCHLSEKAYPIFYKELNRILDN